MVKCGVCGLYFDRLSGHLRAHGLNTYEYDKRFPGAPTLSEECREEFSRIQSERFSRPEERQAQSKAALKVYSEDPTVVVRISESCKVAYKNTPGLYESTCSQLLDATKKRWDTEGSREHASEVTSKSAKDVWDSYTPEEKLARLRSGIHSTESLAKSQESCRRGVSSTEAELWPILDRNYPGRFTWNHGKEKCIGGKFPDFYSDEGKLVIECFGDIWHDYPTAEEDKISHYESYGWSCFVFWVNKPSDVILSFIEVLNWVDAKLKVG